MSEAKDLVNKAAADARSGDDLVSEPMIAMGVMEAEYPLDRETLDERATTRMGERWEMTRRDAT